MAHSDVFTMAPEQLVSTALFADADTAHALPVAMAHADVFTNGASTTCLNGAFRGCRNSACIVCRNGTCGCFHSGACTVHNLSQLSTALLADAATAHAQLVKTTTYSGTASHDDGTEQFLYQQRKVTLAVNSKTPVQLLSSVNPCVKKGGLKGGEMYRACGGVGGCREARVAYERSGIV